jgi:hypothetical protein
MVSAWRADTKDTLPADTIDVFCSRAQRYAIMSSTGASDRASP